MIRSPTTDEQDADPQTAAREITCRFLRHLAFLTRTPQKRALDRFELNHRLRGDREWMVSNTQVAALFDGQVLAAAAWPFAYGKVSLSVLSLERHGRAQSRTPILARSSPPGTGSLTES